MDKILPKTNIIDIQKNSIINKIIPINIIYIPTSYKKVNTSLITNIINLIKNILSTISFVNLITKFNNIIKNINQFLKKIFKKIFKPIKFIIKKIFNFIVIPFKILFNVINKIIIKPFKLMEKIFVKIFNIIKKFITTIKNISIKIFKFIFNTLYKIIAKTSKFILTTIKTSIKIIKLLIQTTKYLGFAKSKKSLKLINGKIYKSPKSIRETFKQLPQIIKESTSKLFSFSTKGNKKSVTSTIKNLINPVLNSSKGLTKWFSNLGKKFFKSAKFAFKIGKILAKVMFKLGTKLALTFAGSILAATGIGFGASVLAFLGKWINGWLFDMAIFNQGVLSWRNIITAILENMPYLDIIFVLDNMLNELMNGSLGIFRPAFKWVQNIFDIKDNDLDINILQPKKQNSNAITQIKDPNLIILNNIKDVKNYQSNTYNLINIVDEIYNENNTSLINTIDNKINVFFDCLKFRNNYILKLA